MFTFLIAGKSTLFTGGIPGVLLDDGFAVDELFAAFIGIQPFAELFA